MALVRFKQIENRLPEDFTISGSLTVYGNATFIQTSSIPALIVSGTQEIVKSDITATTYSASIGIENLGKWADTGSNQTIDLGNESY
jgi:hypothetical protein